MSGSASQTPAGSSLLSPAERLLREFRWIHQHRMHDLPILNPHLQVEVVGGRHWQEGWVGVLITPWCMNLAMLPDSSGLADWQEGATRPIRFPAGTFEFLISKEAGLGTLATCSLFSPMADFPDQETAVAVAAAIDEQLYVSAAQEETSPLQSRLNQPLSRRDLFRRMLGGEG